jgi:hypothetical protein
MRKLALLFFLVASTSVFAQSDDDERWRDDTRDRDRRERIERERDRDRRDRRDRWSSRDNALELTPQVGFRFGGTLLSEDTGFFPDLEVASSASIGGIVGIPVGDTGMKVELSISHQESQLEVEGALFDPADRIADIGVTYYQAGIRFPFATSRNAMPFISVAAGIASLDPQFQGGSSENRFAGSAGIGVKVPFNRNFGLRLEAKGYYTSLGHDDDDCFRCYDDTMRDFVQGETSIGVVFSF